MRHTVEDIKLLLGYDLSVTIDNIKPSRFSDSDTNYRRYASKTFTLKSMGNSYFGTALNSSFQLVFENKISCYGIFVSTIWYVNGANQPNSFEIIRKKEV